MQENSVIEFVCFVVDRSRQPRRKLSHCDNEWTRMLRDFFFICFLRDKCGCMSTKMIQCCCSVFADWWLEAIGHARVEYIFCRSNGRCFNSSSGQQRTKMSAISMGKVKKLLLKECLLVKNTTSESDGWLSSSRALPTFIRKARNELNNWRCSCSALQQVRNNTVDMTVYRPDTCWIMAFVRHRAHRNIPLMMRKYMARVMQQ